MSNSEKLPLPSPSRADLRTDGSPDSEKIEHSVRKHKCETLRAWSKSKTGMSEAKVEQQSTETLSFRCWCERCRLTRGRRVKQSRATELGWGEGSTFNSATVEQLQKPNDETSPVARFRNKFGMTYDFCCLTRGRRMKQKRAAFTLAEVLITLGIIGVVAALTLPMLIQNYKKTETVSRLKKFYSTMSQAIMMSELENGPAGDWEHISMIGSDSKEISGEVNRAGSLAYFNKYLAKYLKYTDVVEDSKLMEDGQDADDTSKFILVKMYDGSYVYLKTGQCIDMRVDIDGLRGQNQFGKDIFAFLICSKGVASSMQCGSPDKAFCPQGGNAKDRTKALSNCEKYPSSCAGLIMYDGWEIKSDYPFKL